MTKTFTATLLAWAIIDKKVSLNDDIRKYLPGNYPNLTYLGHPIRLVNLVNLTSGLPNWLPDNPSAFTNANPDSIIYILGRMHRHYNRKDFYQDLHNVKLTKAPGTDPQHCNVAAQLIGYILENVYHESFSELLSQYFYKPFRMENTGILVSLKSNTHLAKGYDKKGNDMPYIDWNDVQEAGGINSTTTDMINYLKFQLNEQNPAVKLSHQPTIGEIDTDGAIGFNWNIIKSKTGIRKIYHSGGTFGFTSYAVVYPDQKIGVVLLSNENDPNAEDALGNTADKIVEELLNH